MNKAELIDAIASGIVDPLRLLSAALRTALTHVGLHVSQNAEHRGACAAGDPRG